MRLDEQPLVVRLGRRTHNGRSFVQKKIFMHLNLALALILEMFIIIPLSDIVAHFTG